MCDTFQKLAPLIALISLIAAACAAGPPKAATPTEAPPPAWTVVRNGMDAALATPDLGLGEQRFAMVLSDLEGIVRLPVVSFTSYRYPDGFTGERTGPVQTELARFTEFPLGARGIHVATFDFNETGDWSVEAVAPRADGSTSSVEARFTVAPRPRSVAVGDPAPASRNKTIDEVSGISQLTTGSFHDERLYRTSIANAIANDRPFVVVFASPAFCTNAVCGPQVEVESDLADIYGQQVDFIHVDLYDNPDKIRGDLSVAIASPLLAEWGLVSQEWTYVVGSDGLVAARFENFVGAAELSEAIDAALSAG